MLQESCSLLGLISHLDVAFIVVVQDHDARVCQTRYRKSLNGSVLFNLDVLTSDGLALVENANLEGVISEI